MSNKISKDSDSVLIKEASLPEWAPGITKEITKLMKQSLLSVGFGNSVVVDRVVAIVSPSSAPMKRLKDKAKEDSRLVDATHGRRTRSIIVMDSNHIVLSSVQAETISHRYNSLKGSK